MVNSFETKSSCSQHLLTQRGEITPISMRNHQAQRKQPVHRIKMLNAAIDGSPQQCPSLQSNQMASVY
ncbi:hypothetical protein Q8A67_024007 [Cirrhinus molitorella]|uniref:Uncharacterized protein n=1 Tax=Cirrhinus molitorella TaxID=172907 RepID=A0AA88P0Y5_9TELE|nr:hypothetical protein Q8A67_024007 [Cirrhinus molitorella]